MTGQGPTIGNIGTRSGGNLRSVLRRGRSADAVFPETRPLRGTAPTVRV